jgi:hypothetical protein
MKTYTLMKTHKIKLGKEKHGLKTTTPNVFNYNINKSFTRNVDVCVCVVNFLYILKSLSGNIGWRFPLG